MRAHTCPVILGWPSGPEQTFHSVGTLVNIPLCCSLQRLEDYLDFFFLPIFNMQHCLLGNCQSTQESKNGRRHESLLKLPGARKGEPSTARSPPPNSTPQQACLDEPVLLCVSGYEYERGWPTWVTSCIQSGNERNEGKSSYINVLEICRSSQRQIPWAFWGVSDCQYFNF